jgi:hypothetical protein
MAGSPNKVTVMTTPGSRGCVTRQGGVARRKSCTPRKEASGRSRVDWGRVGEASGYGALAEAGRREAASGGSSGLGE